MTKGQSSYRNMSRYSIKDLEHLSGIKAHTLRIWEQRYNLIEPERTDTNIRYYSDEDLKFILNVALLNSKGFKISKIAELSREEVAAEVSKLSAENQNFETDIASLIISTIDLNEALFEQVFQQNNISIGFERTIIEIIYPFLDRIGQLWMSGSISPAQEHFISNLIRQKLIVAIDMQPKVSKPGAKNVMIYTPENELHELSILFACYVFKRQQQRVFYLGTSVPFDNVEVVFRKHEIDIILLNITGNPSGSHFSSYLKNISQVFEGKRIVLTGLQAMKRIEEVPANIEVLGSLEELFAFVNN